MVTSAEYRERIKAMRPNVYLDGEIVPRDDPRIVPGMNVIALTYDLAQDPRPAGCKKLTGYDST